MVQLEKKIKVYWYFHTAQNFDEISQKFWILNISYVLPEQFFCYPFIKPHTGKVYVFFNPLKVYLKIYTYRTQLPCPRKSNDIWPFWCSSQDVLHLRNSSHACGNTYRHNILNALLSRLSFVWSGLSSSIHGWQSDTTAILKAVQDHHFVFSLHLLGSQTVFNGQDV